MTFSSLVWYHLLTSKASPHSQRSNRQTGCSSFCQFSIPIIVISYAIFLPELFFIWWQKVLGILMGQKHLKQLIGPYAVPICSLDTNSKALEALSASETLFHSRSNIFKALSWTLFLSKFVSHFVSLKRTFAKSFVNSNLMSTAVISLFRGTNKSSI